MDIKTGDIQALGYSNKVFYYTTSREGTFSMTDHYIFNEDIDPESMRLAFEEALKLYPEFNIKVLNTDNKFISVRNENPVPLFEEDNKKRVLGSDEVNGYLFYATYSGNKLVASFYHGLSDRFGLMSFIGCVFYLYGQKTGVEFSEEEIKEQKSRIRMSKSDILEDMEVGLDPYKMRADDAVKAPNLYQSPGAAPFEMQEYSKDCMTIKRYLIECSYSKLLRMLIRHRISAAPFLIYVAAKAFNDINDNKEGKPIIAMLPVDYRKRIGVETVVNCSDAVLVPATRQDFELTWQEVCTKMSEHIKEQNCRDNFIRTVTNKVNMIKRFEEGDEDISTIIERSIKIPDFDDFHPFSFPYTFPGSMNMGKGIDKMLKDVYSYTHVRTTFVHGYVYNDNLRLDVAVRGEDDSWPKRMAKVLEEIGIDNKLSVLGKDDGIKLLV